VLVLPLPNLRLCRQDFHFGSPGGTCLGVLAHSPAYDSAPISLDASIGPLGICRWPRVKPSLATAFYAAWRVSLNRNCCPERQTGNSRNRHPHRRGSHGRYRSHNSSSYAEFRIVKPAVTLYSESTRATIRSLSRVKHLILAGLGHRPRWGPVPVACATAERDAAGFGVKEGEGMRGARGRVTHSSERRLEWATGPRANGQAASTVSLRPMALVTATSVERRGLPLADRAR
jgi:hypothetical protein